MTQADSVSALRMSLTSVDPSGAQEQAADATTPLPDGWGSFCSKPYDGYQTPLLARWYAVAPWDAQLIKSQATPELRKLAMKLAATVDADTWPALHEVVAEQCRIYEQVTGSPWSHQR